MLTTLGNVVLSVLSDSISRRRNKEDADKAAEEAQAEADEKQAEADQLRVDAKNILTPNISVTDEEAKALNKVEDEEETPAPKANTAKASSTDK